MQVGKFLRFFPKAQICEYIEPSPWGGDIYIFTTSNCVMYYKDYYIDFPPSQKFRLLTLASDQMPELLNCLHPCPRGKPGGIF